MHKGRRTHGFAAAVLVLAIVACDDGVATGPVDQLPAVGVVGEVRTGWIVGPGELPAEVRYQVVDGRGLLQSDIDLGPVEAIAPTRAELERRLGTGSAGTDGEASLVAIDTKRWPGGVVPYVISNSFSATQRQVILNAMTHIATNAAGISFVARTNQTAYVSFTLHSTICNSAVGRQGGAQAINLMSSCASTFPKVVHETVHALGAWHEQSRCDRDAYVQIQSNNILPGKEDDFAKICNGSTDLRPYNEESIMHYPQNVWSKNDEPTILSLRGLGYTMGTAIDLHAYDTQSLDLMYAPYPLGTLTVSDNGGTALLGWTGGGTQVTFIVRRRVRAETFDEENGTTQYYDVENTTLTNTITDRFYHDGSRAYTGSTTCQASGTPNTTYTYFYEVQGVYGGGGTQGQPVVAFAPIAPPSCW